MGHAAEIRKQLAMTNAWRQHMGRSYQPTLQPFEQPCTVTLSDDGAVTVTRPDGLTVVVKPVEPPIRIDTAS